MRERLRKHWFTWSVLGLGFAFLYLPIFILMAYSFNESKLATVWSGFSFKWYVKLFNDARYRGAGASGSRSGPRPARWAGTWVAGDGP